MNPFRPLRFVILFTGRTGSTFLTESWFDSEFVRWHGEELAHFETPADQTREAARHWQVKRRESYSCLGFKLKLTDCIDPDGLKSLCSRHEAQVICMRRRNYVKQAVSFLYSDRMVEKGGYSNPYREDQRPAPEAFNPEHILIRAGDCERRDRELCDYVRDLARPTLTLFYEDLIAYGARERARVASFLSLPEPPPAAKTLKATNDDLRKALPNFRAVRRALRDTKYSSMLEEKPSRAAA